MGISESRSCIAIPPGATVRELMEDHRIGRQDMQPNGITAEQLNRLLSGEAKLTTVLPAGLENVFHVPASFWINLEMQYRRDLLKVESEQEKEKMPPSWIKKAIP